MKQALWRLAALALTGVVLYALVGYFVAPLLIERRLESVVNAHTGLTLEIDTVSVNPFNLALSIEYLTLFGPENTAAVSIDRTAARIKPGESVAARAWSFDDLVVTALRIDLDGAWVATVDEIRTDPGLGLGFGPDGIRLDGGIDATAFAITNAETGAAVLTGEALRSDSIVVATSPTLLVGSVRLLSPRIHLRRLADGTLDLPGEVTTLLFDPMPGRRMVANVDLHDAELRFDDEAVPAQFTLEDIAGAITQRHDGEDTSVTVAVHARIASGGTADLRAEWHSARQPAAMDVSLGLRDVELPHFSPYVAAAIGRSVDTGVLDLHAELTLDAARADIDNRLEIRHLELAAPHPAATSAELPLEFARALLEDASGRIAFSLPPVELRDLLSDPGTVLPNAFEDFVNSLASAPFDYLADVVDRPDLEFGHLAFLPASADLGDQTRGKLETLASALKVRPTLGMVVHGGYDPTADREGLAREQVRLHVTLAASARPPGSTTDEPVDFDDATVQSVLVEFAAERLSSSQLEAVRNRFGEPDTGYYRALFEALIDNETVQRQALERLARYRARTVADALEEAGIDAARIDQAETVEAVDPSAVTRTVVRLALRPLGPDPVSYE